MPHRLHEPQIDQEACRRAALANNLERAIELGDIDDMIAALDLHTEEIEKQIRARIPIPYKFFTDES